MSKYIFILADVDVIYWTTACGLIEGREIILTEIPTNQYTSEACGNSEKANWHPQQIFVAPFKVNTKYTIFLRFSRILQGNQKPLKHKGHV